MTDLETQVLQIKEFMKTYQKVTQVCFLDCVQDFGSRELSTTEKTCQNNCMKKYMATTTRIAQRFSEYHLQEMEGKVSNGDINNVSKF